MGVHDSRRELDAQRVSESQGLVAEFARHVLQAAASEELVLFEETAAEYFADPEAVPHPRQHEEALEFGLDVQLLTPYVLAIATPVIQLLMSFVADTARDASKPHVARLVRCLFRKGDEVPEETSPVVSPLTNSQTLRVRQITYERAKGLGLDEDRAQLLADCVVGGLARDDVS